MMRASSGAEAGVQSSDAVPGIVVIRRARLRGQCHTQLMEPIT